MGVPTSEVGYTSTTTERGDHEVHKGHVVALKNNPKPDKSTQLPINFKIYFNIILYAS
jgi:hypothetical protein